MVQTYVIIDNNHNKFSTTINMIIIKINMEVCMRLNMKNKNDFALFFFLQFVEKWTELIHFFKSTYELFSYFSQCFGYFHSIFLFKFTETNVKIIRSTFVKTIISLLKSCLWTYMMLNLLTFRNIFLCRSNTRQYFLHCMRCLKHNQLFFVQQSFFIEVRLLLQHLKRSLRFELLSR